MTRVITCLLLLFPEAPAELHVLERHKEMCHAKSKQKRIEAGIPSKALVRCEADFNCSKEAQVLDSINPHVADAGDAAMLIPGRQKQVSQGFRKGSRAWP